MGVVAKRSQLRGSGIVYNHNGEKFAFIESEDPCCTCMELAVSQAYHDGHVINGLHRIGWTWGWVFNGGTPERTLYVDKDWGADRTVYRLHGNQIVEESDKPL